LKTDRKEFKKKPKKQLKKPRNIFKRSLMSAINCCDFKKRQDYEWVTLQMSSGTLDKRYDNGNDKSK